MLCEDDAVHASTLDSAARSRRLLDIQPHLARPWVHRSVGSPGACRGGNGCGPAFKTSTAYGDYRRQCREQRSRHVCTRSVFIAAAPVQHLS